MNSCSTRRPVINMPTSKSDLDDLFAKAEEAGAVLIARAKMLEAALTRRPPPAKPHRQRKARKPTLASVAKQASKALWRSPATKSSQTAPSSSSPARANPPSENPWLDDLKVTKQ